MPSVNKPKTGGDMADGRFRTRRQYTVNGISIEKSFVQKKKESKSACIARADKWLHEARDKQPSPKMKLRRAFEIWIDHKRAQKRAPRTIEDYEDVRDWICAEFGEMAVSSFSSYHAQQCINKWLAQDQDRTALKVRTVGGNAFGFFLRSEWIPKVKGNPFKMTDPVSYEPEEDDEPMAPQAFEAALAQVDSAIFRAYFLLLRFTGMRPTAAAELLRTNLEEREDGMWMKKYSKTKASKKWNPVPSRAAAAIRELPTTSLYVFPNKQGEPYSEEWLNKVWIAAQRAAKSEDLRTLYQLRHMRATELIDRAAELGIDVVHVTRQLGHSKAAITRQAYHQQRHDTLRKLAEGE